MKGFAAYEQPKTVRRFVQLVKARVTGAEVKQCLFADDTRVKPFRMIVVPRPTEMDQAFQESGRGDKLVLRKVHFRHSPKQRRAGRKPTQSQVARLRFRQPASRLLGRDGQQVFQQTLHFGHGRRLCLTGRQHLVCGFGQDFVPLWVVEQEQGSAVLDKVGQLTRAVLQLSLQQTRRPT